MEKKMSTIKQKLTFDDMIDHFKKKNVTFNLISEKEAKEILEDRTYFYKLKSYKANFPINGHGQFKELDFGMLMDISIIDSHLRTFVLNVTLNIEHTMKTKLLKLITENPKEDGYQIIQEFIVYNNSKSPKYPISIESLWGKSATSYHTKDMYEAYKTSTPVWVIFEVITYGDLVKFAEFYRETRHRDLDSEFKEVITAFKFVKFLRNMAAHNSPIIRNIQKVGEMKHTQLAIKEFLRNVNGYQETRELSYLKNRTVHHLIVMLFVFDKVVTSKGARINTYLEFEKLIKRSRRLMRYYTPNHYSELMQRYLFLRKVSKYLIQKEK